MGKLRLLILRRYMEDVTAALGEFGGVHLVEPSDSRLTAVDARTEISQLDALLGRCNTLLDRLGVEEGSDPLPSTQLGLQELVTLLSKVEDALEKTETELEARVRESGLLVRKAQQLRRLPTENVPLSALRSLGHLYLVVGRLNPSLAPLAQAAVGDRGVVLNDPSSDRPDQLLILTTRRGRWAVESDIQEFGFEREELPEDVDVSAPEAEAQAQDRLEKTRLEIVECQNVGRELAVGYGPQLLAARRQLVRSLAMARAQENFGGSERLVCIAGWIPMREEETVRRVVEETTQGTGIVELRPADDDPSHGEVDVVPVQLDPKPWLRPFHALVGNFGSPRYGELDPSLFVAFTFVLMFGIMFGDVGQGAVVAGVGVWLLRTKNPMVRPFRDGGTLLMFCGGSSMIFGFLYGSIFGYEEWLHPIWLSPMHDVSRLLGTAVGLGVAFISIAIIINIINKFRSRHFFESVFDKFGILGIIFYWGALGLGLKAARAGELDPAHIVLVIVVPLALLFVREPLHNLLLKRKLLHSDPFSFVLEACIETLETLTAFLGSTVSFARVGAFALSHAALCLAIFSVADILRALPVGGLWAAIVLVLGNLLVIVMEGMVAMIQGVRLEYYELFSKYFAGDGVAYHPFELQKMDQNNTRTSGDTES
jgi:V/A-type H+-transporting ATPase subunit I